MRLGINRMTDEEYLIKKEWIKNSNNLWNHKNCNYGCCLEVAIMAQNKRDEKNNYWVEV